MVPIPDEPMLNNQTAYRYRKLTPTERAEVTRQRRARGYPLHAPPHPYRHAGHYFITAATYEHRPIMAASARRTEFEADLLQQAAEAEIDVHAWVILPNHYHLLVGVGSLDQVSSTLKQVHGATARRWNQEDGLTGLRKVWYKFQDRLIRDDDHFYRALNYIHYNPVKHQYVNSPYDWPWVSLENYVQHIGRNWLRQQWREHPPGDFGAGWDD